MKIKVTVMDGVTIFEHRLGRSLEQEVASCHFHFVGKDGYLSTKTFVSKYAAYVGYFQEYPRVITHKFGFNK